MEKLVGLYSTGPDCVELCVRSGFGGDCYVIPNEKTGLCKIVIGIDYGDWKDVFRVFLHEVLEYVCIKENICYSPYYEFGEDLTENIFMMDHARFAEVCGRAAKFIVEAEGGLKTEWIRKSMGEKEDMKLEEQDAFCSKGKKCL